jgi:hypothetical protein
MRLLQRGCVPLRLFCFVVFLAEADELHIPQYRIVHQGVSGTGPGCFEDHRYPFAGAANPRVRLGVVPARGGDAGAAGATAPVWMDLGPDPVWRLASPRPAALACGAACGQAAAARCCLCLLPASRRVLPRASPLLPTVCAPARVDCPSCVVCAMCLALTCVFGFECAVCALFTHARKRWGCVPRWFCACGRQEVYLARVAWLAPGVVAAQLQSREQTVLELCAFDVATGVRALLLREEAASWINLNDMFTLLPTP